jgi:hypothetical protein
MDWIYLAQDSSQWPAHGHGSESNYMSHRNEKEVNYILTKSIKINRNINSLISFIVSFSHYMFLSHGSSGVL